MKFIVVGFIAICLLAAVEGHAQKVTLSVKHASLESVLKQIKKQTGYSIFYNESILTGTAKVTMNCKNVGIDTALAACLGNQPTLMYEIIGKTVVISEKAPAKAGSEQPAAGSSLTVTGSVGRTIHGGVFNTRYERLANASVVIVGTQKGTLTKGDGTFTLGNLHEDDVL